MPAVLWIGMGLSIVLTFVAVFLPLANATVDNALTPESNNYLHGLYCTAEHHDMDDMEDCNKHKPLYGLWELHHAEA